MTQLHNRRAVVLSVHHLMEVNIGTLGTREGCGVNLVDVELTGMCCSGHLLHAKHKDDPLSI